MLNCGGYTPNVCADFCNVAILHCPVSHASATPVPTIKTVFGIPLINGFFIFCARKIKNKGITLTNGVSNTVTNPFNDNHTNAPAAMFPIRAALGIHFIRSLLTNPPAISTRPPKKHAATATCHACNAFPVCRYIGTIIK